MKQTAFYRSRWMVLTFSIICIMSILLAGCAQQAATKPAETPKTPIKIGGTLPLTGIYADTGKEVYSGYQHWLEVVNASGGMLGRKVELTIYDDASDVKNAVTLLEKLITVDKVDLLAGGYPGTCASAQMSVAEQYKKVYVSMGGHMTSFTKGYTYSFGAPPLMGEWWFEGIYRWLGTVPQAERPKSVAIFTMNNPIGAALLADAVDRFKSLGIEVVINEKYDLPLASADSIVAKAKAANAEVFVSGGLLPDGVLTVKACKTQGYNPKLYLHGIGSITRAWVAELGSDGNYICSGNCMSYRLPYPGVDELNKWYAANNPPATNAPDYFLFGYCWMQVLQKGVEGSQSLDDTKIRDWLKSNEINVIGGKWRFDSRGLPPTIDLSTQIIDGKVELIWPPDVRTHDPVYPKPAWGK